MSKNRDLIRKLATDASVAAGTRQAADRIQARAAAIDPEGQFEVVRVSTTIGTLRRISFEVRNNDPEAGKTEFGDSGAGKTGRSGLRPLGRAARSI